MDNSSCRPQCMLSNSSLPCNIMTFLFFLGILHMNSITLFKAYSIELNTMKNTWESRDQIYCKSQFTGDMNSWWEIFLLFCCSVVSNSLWPHGLQHTRLSCPSLFPGVCSNSYSLGGNQTIQNIGNNLLFDFKNKGGKQLVREML